MTGDLWPTIEKRIKQNNLPKDQEGKTDWKRFASEVSEEVNSKESSTFNEITPEIVYEYLMARSIIK